MFEIVTSDRIYLIQAASDNEREDWLEACEKVIPDKVIRNMAPVGPSGLPNPTHVFPPVAEKEDGKTPKRKEREGTFFSKLINVATGGDKEKAAAAAREGKLAQPIVVELQNKGKDDAAPSPVSEKFSEYDEDDDHDEVNLNDGPQPIEAVKVSFLFGLFVLLKVHLSLTDFFFFFSNYAERRQGWLLEQNGWQEPQLPEAILCSQGNKSLVLQVHQGLFFEELRVASDAWRNLGSYADMIFVSPPPLVTPGQEAGWSYRSSQVQGIAV
jgi:hypothetical protein